jgi:hypothetical protein
MSRCGSTTSTHDTDAEIRNMVQMELREILRSEVVVSAAVDDTRQAGVGKNADRNRATLAEISDVLLHLGRSGRAVDTEDVGSIDVNAAPISLPTSMRPVVSMVTWT